MGRAESNRPFKFGPDNRREFIVQDSEVAFRAYNNSDGNPLFLGRAKPGSAESDPVWQIAHITYDDNQGVTSITWPENDEGAFSSNYEFIWDDFTLDVAVVDVTQANPAVVTVTDIAAFEAGDLITFSGVEGMTELNFTGSNIYTIANLLGNTFELVGIDSSAFPAYSGGGVIKTASYSVYVYG